MMKSTTYIFMSLTLLALISCNKVVRPSDDSERIEFGIPMLEGTKAAFKESADDLAEDGFSVFAIKYTEDSEVMRFMNNVKVSRTDGVWDYDGAYYWSPMAYHSFYAFYPYCDGIVGDYKYESSVENANLVITPKSGPIRTGTNADVTDILYGISSYMAAPFDVSQPVDKVVFIMKHVFSSVKLNLINRSDYKITAVSGKISGSDGTLPGLYDACDSLVINADETIQWNDLQIAADPGAFSFEHTDMNLLQGAETAVFEELVIPQNINTSAAGVKDRMHLRLSVTFATEPADTAEFTVCLADIELSEQDAQYKKTYLPGKRYEYNLNVTSDYITCSVDLVEWTDDDMIDL